MKLSYEGIGQWAATFACDGVEAGAPVKISGNGAVAACGSGEQFCGQVISCARDGKACAVALGGMVTMAYTGTAPAVGWANLSADGSGGVKADSAGRSYLVTAVDTAAKMVTFVL